MRLPVLVGLVIFVLAGPAVAQRNDDRAQFNARMNVLEREVSELSIQIERLKTNNEELGRKLDAMRARLNERLRQLERGTVPTTRPKP
jgi:septal ring factor EnvC (AmiA/AmiB activator)